MNRDVVQHFRWIALETVESGNTGNSLTETLSVTVTDDSVMIVVLSELNFSLKVFAPCIELRPLGPLGALTEVLFLLLRTTINLS